MICSVVETGWNQMWQLTFVSFFSGKKNGSNPTFTYVQKTKLILDLNLRDNYTSRSQTYQQQEPFNKQE